MFRLPVKIGLVITADELSDMALHVAGAEYVSLGAFASELEACLRDRIFSMIIGSLIGHYILHTFRRFEVLMLAGLR